MGAELKREAYPLRMGRILAHLAAQNVGIGDGARLAIGEGVEKRPGVESLPSARRFEVEQI